MSVKKTQFKKDTFYFFTITCYNWIPLFEITNLYDNIYRWFDILKSKKIKVISYVIMPNHLHMIVFFHEQKESINNIIGTGKRFMAYEIVERLKMKKNIFILKKLEEGVNEIERRRGKLHQMFQPSFDLKALDTEKFLLQKINYIHNNPVSKKWNLVEDYRQYPFSSAGYYELGEVNGYEVTHYLEI